MYCTRKITNSIHWVGGNDRRLALFENLFPIPRGVSYNSYLIEDEKIALIDTVDASITQQYLENVLFLLNGRTLDYLIINHMEPDHCANIEELLLRFPDLKIVGNAQTFSFIKQFYNFNLDGHTITVKENDSLSLGNHTLRFYFAPMVHWPEVMVTYEETKKVLFSADAFGCFGALNGNIFSDEVDFDRDWISDARRYYGNIVGKYGLQVQKVLKKLSGLELNIICPLHGPVWRDNFDYLLGKYDLWSRYEAEERTVAIISSTHISTLIAEIFRCSHLVLAAPTYNGGIYPPMLNLLHDMKALNLSKRTIALIGNGTWAPLTAPMQTLLEEMKQMQILEPVVTLKTTLKEDSMEQLNQLKLHLLSSLSE